MSISIVPQLVKKDLLLWRKMILIFGLVNFIAIGILAMLYGRVPNWVFSNLGFSLLIIPGAACGMALLMQTNVFEKVKSTQPFIMSLPVTVKEFTLAKLLVNIPVFTAFWLVMISASFYFCFGLGLFPMGALPFMVMVFLGIFVAYTLILSVSILFQSLGITVIAIMLFEMGTPAYLWTVVYLNPISDYIYGSEAVWNSTALTIVTIQVLVVIFTVSATYFIQSRKRDFI